MAGFVDPTREQFKAMMTLPDDGPVQMLNLIRLRDQAAYEDGREATGAEAYATYEFVSAQEYLEKAREEWAYSDYQKALEYAERALQFAEQAYERAVNNPNRGAPDIEDVF